MRIGITQSGITIIDSSVNFGWFQSKYASKPTSVAGSFTITAVALLMMPCSVAVSFMIRDISSPVLLRLKNPAGKFIRCANSRMRKSVMARIATHCSR